MRISANHRGLHGSRAAAVVVAASRPTGQRKRVQGAPPLRTSDAPTPIPAAEQQLTSPSRRPSSASVGGGLNGSGPAAIHLAYASGWRKPLVHHSVADGAWGSSHMHEVTSGGGAWKHLQLQANGSSSAAAPFLEFVITDEEGSWDKAPDGGNYVAAQPGRYWLQEGSLLLAAGPPVLLVSDLDETMIGDDEATAAFRDWWQQHAVAAGGRLVYNTGRALDLFQELLAEKGDCLPEPDMLISSLGTRIYKKEGQQWVEDEGYTASLGAGWELEAVREACYAALAAVGKEQMHFRPPSEMNSHKVTCGVHADVLQETTSSIQGALQAQRVAHKLVVSGKGDWRYVDLVPPQAGKLQALEYARRSLGFAPEQTVACGDSGNDIDMLEGEHLSIVVGNAQPDLLEWVQQREALPPPGLQRPLLARANRAWGILEGLETFGFK